MGKLYRSARGQMVDFDLLAIKAQLAASPPPRAVEERKRAMDAKDGIKTDAPPDLEFMALAMEGVKQSAAAAQSLGVPEDPKPQQGKQLKQK